MKFSPLIILTFLLITGCKTNKNSEIQVFESAITSITSKDTATVGDNVSVTVNFTGPNGCTKPYSIEAEKVGQTITLKAYYSEPTNSSCLSVVKNHSLLYSFYADLPDPYFFISAKNNTISDTLHVH